MKIIVISISLMTLNFFSLLSNDKIKFDINNKEFVDYIGSFVDLPLSDYLNNIIRSGYYYRSIDEVLERNNLVGWEFVFTEKLSIIIYFFRWDSHDFLFAGNSKYPWNKFDINQFLKVKISQIMIRHNMEEDPLNHYYKWVILPREKEQSNKKIKK